jgi:hypothetical protein
MRLVMQLLNHSELDTLITGESTFDELPELMRSLTQQSGVTMCHRIAYR